MSKFQKFQLFLLVITLSSAGFFGGLYLGRRGFYYDLKKNPPYVEVVNKYPTNQKVDFALFWDVWDMVGSKYLERPVDRQKMLYGAISGMVNSLGDPYTSFLSPEINKNFTSSLEGTYTGIGAELGVKDNQLIVVAPLDGSPAKDKGVLPGDKILKINGDSTFGLGINEAVSKIRGEAGTLVTLTLQRGSDKPFDLGLQRGTITVSSVSWKDKGDGTAYIRISRFGPDTNDEWSKAVSDINTKMKELDALIIDVRGNPGGYLQSAVYIAGEFFKDKPAVFEELPTGEQLPLNTDRIGSFTKIPVIYVLIDGGSASASEILAGALRDQIKAKLIGTKSFGKGTIQDARDFKDGSGVHITIAKWLTPTKIWVHKKGIEPDIKVEETPEDAAKGVDKALEKAVELAKQF